MSSAAPKAEPEAFARDDEPVRLDPEDEAWFDAMEAEAEADERAGRGMTWEQFLAGREARRAR
jgi:hypothetical protein